MTVFGVVFDGTRVNDADVVTGWANDGQNAVLDADQFYQGSGSIGAQIKTADAGFKYTSSSQDLTGRTALIKMVSGRPGGLQGNGLSIRIGSSDGSNYYLWNLLSATTYPPVGGWQIMAVNPNVSQWRSATSGTPNMSAATYWSFRAHYTSNTQGRNTFADAIDHIATGKGLTGTAGGGGDPAGSFANFATADAGTDANRWGIVTVRDGILFVAGTLTIGSSVATEFTSVGETLVFPDHRVTTNFCGLAFDLQNASTNINIDGALFNGRGALYTSDDTRPRYSVSSTSGLLTITGSNFSGFEQAIFNTACSITSCTFSTGGLITAAGANLSGSSIVNSTTSVALLWNVNLNTNGLLNNMSFISAGTGHAIELGPSTPDTIAFFGHSYTGYAGTDGSSGDEVLYNNSGKAITVQITGFGNMPTIRNGTDASTIVDVAIDLNITVIDADNQPIEDARVIIIRNSDLAILLNDFTDINGEVSDTYSGTTPINITYRVRKSSPPDTRYFDFEGAGIVSSLGFSASVRMIEDTTAA